MQDEAVDQGVAPGIRKLSRDMFGRGCADIGKDDNDDIDGIFGTVAGERDCDLFGDFCAQEARGVEDGRGRSRAVLERRVGVGTSWKSQREEKEEDDDAARHE